MAEQDGNSDSGAAGLKEDPTGAVESYGSFADKILGRVFGSNWDELTLDGGPGGAEGGDGVAPTLIFEVLQNTNEMALAVVSTVFIYIMAVATVGSAHEGQALGKSYHTIWTPVRSVMSVAMLAPVAKGLSILQVLILMLVGASSQITNQFIWEPALDFLVDSGGQVIVSSSSATDKNAKRIADTALNAALYQEFFAVEMQAEYEGGRMSSSFMVDADAAADQGSGGEGSAGGDSGYHVFNFHGPETIPLQAVRSFEPSDASGGSGSSGDGQIKEVELNNLVRTKPTSRPGPPDDPSVEVTLGRISIPCVSQGTSLCNARKKAAAKLVGEMREVAQKIVADEEKPDRGTVQAAVDEYTATLDASAAEAIRNDNQDMNESLEQFSETAKEVGWVSAGMWYWTITGFQQRAQDLASATVVVEQPDARSLSGALNDQIAGNVKSAEDRLGSAVTDLKAVASSYTDGSGPSLPTLLGFFLDDETLLHPGENGIFAIVDGDPLRRVSAMGHTMISAAETLAVGAVGVLVTRGGIKGARKGNYASKAFNTLTGGIAGGTLGAFTALLEVMGSVLGFMFLSLIVPALFFAYYLPAIPFFMWYSAIIGWLIMIVVAMVAAPLWAGAHAMPDGEQGLANQTAQQGYRVMLSVLLRPPLMLIGLLFAIGLIAGIMNLLAMAFAVFFAALEAGQSTGLISMIVMTILFGAIVVIYTHRIFGLITDVPERAMEFIGARGLSMGEDQDKSQIYGMAMGGFREGAGARNAITAGTMAGGALPAGSGGSGGSGGGGGGGGGSNTLAADTDDTTESDMQEGETQPAESSEGGGEVGGAEEDGSGGSQGDATGGGSEALEDTYESGDDSGHSKD